MNVIMTQVRRHHHRHHHRHGGGGDRDGDSFGIGVGVTFFMSHTTRRVYLCCIVSIDTDVLS